MTNVLAYKWNLILDQAQKLKFFDIFYGIDILLILDKTFFQHHSRLTDYGISKTKSLDTCEKEHGEVLGMITTRTDNSKEWRRFVETIE